MLISYFHNMILSAGCSVDDRDSGSAVANEYEILISYCHDMILSAGCSVDDRDRWRYYESIMAT